MKTGIFHKIWLLAICCVLIVLMPCYVSPVFGSERMLMRADAYLMEGNYIRAKQLYKEIFFLSKEDTLAEKALFGLGRSYFYLGNYHLSRHYLNLFIQVSQETEYLNKSYLLLGFIALHLQEFKEARRYFEMVGGHLKNEAKIGKSEAALRFGHLAEASLLMEKVDRRLQETDPRALYIRAMIYSKRELHEEALKTINKVSIPFLIEHRLMTDKAQILLNAGQLEEAERVSIGILNDAFLIIERRDAKEVLMQIYEAEGRVDEALNVGLELLPFVVGDDLKLTIITLYHQKGDIGNIIRFAALLDDREVRSKEIEKGLRKGIEIGYPGITEYIIRFSPFIDPDSPFIVDASRHLIADGRRDEGMRLLEMALRGAAKGDASLLLSELLIGAGKYKEAKELLEPLTRDNRLFRKASYMMGAMLERMGEYISAIEYLKRATKNIKDRRIAARVGDLYWRAGERSIAMRYYAIASGMGCAVSSIKVGDYFYIAGDHKRAEFHYRRALDYDIEDVRSLQWAQYQYGKLTINRDYLLKAIDGGGEIAGAAVIILGGH